jgi:hypothetical protein
MLIGSTLLGMAVSATAFSNSLAGDESDEAKRIKAEFMKQAERIESLDVRYKLDTTSPLTADELLALPGFQNQIFLPKDEWREAFKGDKRYRRQIQPERMDLLVKPDEFGLFPPKDLPADAPEEMKRNQKELQAQHDRAVAHMRAMKARGVAAPQRDPAIRLPSERDVTWGYNGRTLWRKSGLGPESFEYQVWSAKSRPNWFQVGAYLSSVGLHVPDPAGSADAVRSQALLDLRQQLKNSSYELEPQTEVVDGSTCVILKGTLDARPDPVAGRVDLSDRIWLDRDHGLVVRKREMARDGVVMNRIATSKLKEVQPGLWLPMVCTRDTFSPNAPVAKRDRPILTETVTVESLEINNVADDLFDMTPQKKDTIHDLRGGL